MPALVNPVQKLSRSFKCLFICTYIVLIGCVGAGVAQYLRHFFSTQSCLNEPGAGRSSQTAKTQTVWLPVKNTRPSTRGLKRSFDRRDTKHQIVIIFCGSFPQGLEFQTKPITHGNGAGLNSFSSERRDVDLRSLYIAPLQLEYLPGSHSGINRADQDGLQVRESAGTSVQQAGFFIGRQHSYTFTLIGDGDQRLAFTKWTLGDPSFTFGNVQDAAKSGEFPVNTGNASILSPLSGSAQPFGLVGLEIGIRDRSDSTFAEVSVKSFGVSFHGAAGAQAGHLSIINVDRIDGVSFQVPVEHLREFGAWSVDAGDIQGLAFFEGFTQAIAGFSFGCARAPECFTLSIFSPRNSGVDVAISRNDLDFMIAGHLLPGKLYQRKLTTEIKSNRERDCAGSASKNQEHLKDIDVLSGVRQDSEGEIVLTSNQKVAGSSPAGCIKTSAKTNFSKVRFSLSGNAIRCAIPSRERIAA